MSRPPSAAGTRRRRAAYRRGLAAESLAAMLLRVKGYRILARRARTPAGEIDLVARRGRLFVFVEVKTRREGADEAVTARQRARIARAAEAWLARAGRHGALPADFAARFDVILLAPWRRPRHLPDAFGHES